MADPSDILPVPKHPNIILTPASSAPISKTGIKLLTDQCAELVASSETYSVTNIPARFADPNRSKNHFFSLSPHWWQIADGSWERRDGQRNPSANEVQCQSQLENMAMSVHTLALGYEHVADPTLRDACLAKAEHLLKTFFLDSDTFMLPEVEFSQCNAGEHPLKGNEGFIVATRFLILVSQAMSHLPAWPVRSGVEDWFRSHIDWMRTSPQGRKASRPDVKMSRWYHAALASYLQISSPAESVSHAKKTLKRLMMAHPDPSKTFLSLGELGSRPRHNTLFRLERLFILASLAVNSQDTHDEFPTAVPGATEKDGSPASSSNDEPSASPTQGWLQAIVQHAERTRPGEIEVFTDSDERYEAKLAVFKRQLARPRQKADLADDEADGSPWAGGWKSWSRLAWSML